MGSESGDSEVETTVELDDVDPAEYVKGALAYGRPKHPCRCDECACELHSYSDADVCVWCKNDDHATTEIPEEEFGSDEWKRAVKKAVAVDYRGPYTSPEVVETIEGDFEVDQEYIREHGGFVIIRGVEGEIYPCGLDIFKDTYRLLGPGSE